MSDNKNRDNEKQDEKFDRQAYLKEVRQGLLKNLGLPPETRPENVAKLLEIKRLMNKPAGE